MMVGMASVDWTSVGDMLGARAAQFITAGGHVRTVTGPDDAAAVLVDIESRIAALTTDQGLEAEGHYMVRSTLQPALRVLPHVVTYLADLNGVVVGAMTVNFTDEVAQIWSAGSTRATPGIGTAMLVALVHDAVTDGIGIAGDPNEVSRWYWDPITGGGDQSAPSEVAIAHEAAAPHLSALPSLVEGQ